MKLMPKLAQSPEFIVQRKITTNYLGFTLIELLVVITLIAVLTVVGVVVYGGLQKQSRDAKRVADIDALAKVYESQAFDVSTKLYRPLTENDFANGSLPEPPRRGDYTGLVTSSSPTFNICTKLEDNPDGVCTNSGPGCYCKSSLH